MAQAPGLRSISVEDLDQKDPAKAMSQLVELLNPMLSSVSTGMNKGLNVTENLNVVVKDITVRTPAQVWITPTLLNSWVNYDAGVETHAAYRIDDDGMVHVKGLVKTGTPPAVIFTLPVGYRPPGHIVFSTVSNESFGVLRVLSDGSITPSVGSATWFSIGEVAFTALAPAATPAFVGGDWPLLVDSGQQSPILDVKLGSVQDLKGNTNLSHGAAGVHWEPGPAGKVIIRRITRLAPERSYKIKLLLYPT